MRSLPAASPRKGVMSAGGFAGAIAPPSIAPTLSATRHVSFHILILMMRSIVSLAIIDRNNPPREAVAAPSSRPRRVWASASSPLRPDRRVSGPPGSSGIVNSGLSILPLSAVSGHSHYERRARNEENQNQIYSLEQYTVIPTATYSFVP
eukprot:COSAG06_NODE_17043_length_965_cov_1.039261_2_plen_149_part_01